MEDFHTDIIINGLDLLDVQKFIDDKKRRYIAITLSDLERTLDRDSFKVVRKAFLDGFNEYTRSLMRGLFGEIG